MVERAESVGIIGAGPGGLAAADMLRRAGVQVTVYDRYDRGGGLMTYGIPGFKLEKDVVMQRIAQLTDGGVDFVLNCNVGEDRRFDAIRGSHDAVLIATGVYKSRDLQAPGSDAAGIVRAIDYLTASNRKSFGDEVPEFDSGELNAVGQARGRDRRRRYRDGLRSHRDPAGRRKRQVPVPSRPGQHAGQPARGPERRGRGRGIRLAFGSQGV